MKDWVKRIGYKGFFKPLYLFCCEVKLMPFFNFGKKEEPKKIDFVESDEVVSMRNNYIFEKNKTRDLEKKLIEQKSKERWAKAAYQHKCSHQKLVKSKSNDGGYDGYFVKCELCGAELFDHSTAINYLNTLLGLLNKFPKVTEASSMAKVSLNLTEDKYEDIMVEIQTLINNCSSLRNDIQEMTSTDFNNNIKEFIYKKG